MSETKLERSGSPKGWKRAMFRAPIALYRAGLGFLLGKRFVMIEHRGRKTGETRRTILEVVVNDPDAVYVASGWGEKAQWLRNIRADPSVVFHLGSRRYETTAVQLDRDEAERVMSAYVKAHPRATKALSRLMLDDPGDTPEEQARRIADSVPLVRLPK
jgi:deazaflavin-dependent oxidoreductase (nitroreductase family)